MHPSPLRPRSMTPDSNTSTTLGTFLRAAWYAMALALCTPALAAEDTLEETPVAPGPLRMDWVRAADVPDAQRNLRCELCGGRYIDPLAGRRDEDPDAAPIRARARRTELQGSTVTLSGGVEVVQGYREFSSDAASIDRSSRTGVLEGNIEVREPGVLLRGERGEYTSATGEAQLENSLFVLHEQHLRGSAALLSREADERIRVEDGAMTFCAPDNNDWLLHTRELELDVDRGSASRAAPPCGPGVPLLYLPWLSFPIDDRRRSGLLFPTFGSDSRGGVDIGTPIYVNLAPNYDLTYTPRYISRRGLNHEVLGRYLDPWERPVAGRRQLHRRRQAVRR
jgi:LPS-assembly protein